MGYFPNELQDLIDLTKKGSDPRFAIKEAQSNIPAEWKAKVKQKMTEAGGAKGPGKLKQILQSADKEYKAKTEKAAQDALELGSQVNRFFMAGFLHGVDKEAKEKWIQKAIKKPGALKRQLGVPEDEKIPAAKLEAAAKAPGKKGQRARLAKTLRKLQCG